MSRLDVTFLDLLHTPMLAATAFLPPFADGQRPIRVLLMAEPDRHRDIGPGKRVGGP